jgi:hypothetical protein
MARKKTTITAATTDILMARRRMEITGTSLRELFKRIPSKEGFG